MSQGTSRAQDTRATWRCKEFPLAGLDFDSSGYPLLQGPDGTALIQTSATYKIPQTIAIPVTAGDGSGVTESTANPFGATVMILNAVLDVTTAATGACTLDIGIGADATTSNDRLFDGLDVNAATGVFNGAVNGGTNGRGAQKWTSTGCLNIAEASGDITGLVGVLYVTVVRV